MLRTIIKWTGVLLALLLLGLLLVQIARVYG